MGLRNHFADYPEFILEFEQNAQSILNEVEQTCKKMSVEHKVYHGERIGAYEYRIRVQGVPIYARGVIVGYDGYLEFGHLSLCQGEWEYNPVCQERLYSKDGKIFLGEKEIIPGRHSLIPYINKIIETTVQEKRVLAYCPDSKTWQFTDRQVKMDCAVE